MAALTSGFDGGLVFLGHAEGYGHMRKHDHVVQREDGEELAGGFIHQWW
jgi:hypothetical protein